MRPFGQLGRHCFMDLWMTVAEDKWSVSHHKIEKFLSIRCKEQGTPPLFCDEGIFIGKVNPQTRYNQCGANSSPSHDFPYRRSVD